MIHTLKRAPLFVVVAALIFVSFLLGFIPNNGLLLAMKIVLIFLLVAGAYFLFDGSFKSAQETTQEMDTGELREAEEGERPRDWLKIENDKDVEEIFNSFLDSAIPLVKKTIVAETVVFLLADFSKKKFYLRYKATDHEEQFIKDKYLDINLGLPSLILKNKTPIIENHLPQEDHIIPYYREGSVPARSFLGTPIYFNQHTIGVLCADSSIEESFSNEDLQILTSFSNLISIQLISSNRLYEYETENWIARVLNEFSKDLLQLQTTQDLWEYCGKSFRSVFQADRVLIALKRDDNTGRIVFMAGDVRSLKVGQDFPLNEGIAGWVLRKNQALLVEDFATKENYIPRFYVKEHPAKEYRSLMAVPIEHQKKALGLICLESYKQAAFKEQYQKILETMAYQIAAFLVKSEVVQRLQSQNLFDTRTGLRNKKAFAMEVLKEIDRAKRFDRKFCLALFKINASPAEMEADLWDRVISEFLSFILPSLDEAHYIFRLWEKMFAVIKVEQELRDVLPQIQKICDVVAEKTIWADGLVQNLFINCGVVQYPDNGVDVKELTERALAAVSRAEEKGPNTLAIHEKTERVDI